MRIQALYVRVSTEEQAKEGQSIEAQISRLEAYAEFKGWQNTEVFRDDGESAKNMNRPDMKRLLKLIKQNKVSVVATMAVDRLSRNLLDMLQFVELCEKHGAAYICAGLNFDTSTPIGRMVLQILAAFAEFERSMTSTRVKNTMIEIAEKTGRYQARAPFGYKLNEKKLLEIVPEEAEWVKRAADMFIGGYGYRTIATQFNEAGIRTKFGATWASSTVRGMLTNELYIGTMIFNRRYYNSEGQLRWRDESEWIVRKNAHPAIYSDEQWRAISARVKRKAPRGGRRQYAYRLSGLIRCSICGAPMVSRIYGNKGPNKDRRIFVCANYQKAGGCRFNYVFMDELEPQVLSLLSEFTQSDINIDSGEFADAIAESQADFERRRNAIEVKFQRQIQAFEDGLIDSNDLRIARERVLKERELLVEDIKRAEETENVLAKDYLVSNAKHALWLWDHGEMPILQNTLRHILDCFLVEDGHITSYRFNPGLITIE